ncbi:MAG TPA: thiamine pyrophosphate-requiring protein [Chloroflexota bacterium]|nr:thiamine pyrophosphate-requiring protein [Chloroflexota bacterium]
MRTIDAIAQLLRQEGIRYLSCFPTTPLIEACAQAEIQPIVCRQERVGVGIADGYSRVTNGATPGVFAMQFGPGAENAFAGVATAYSDGVPVLLLPLGQAEDRLGVAPLFGAVAGFGAVTKRVEPITSPRRTADVMRRAMAALRQGRPGPVMVEIPADVALQEVPQDVALPRPIPRTVSAGDPRDVARAARALCDARHPVVLAGQGVLYAEASGELLALAEQLDLPVMTTLLGKSAFPETHRLSLGCATHVMTPAAHHFLQRADLILAAGTSLTRHFTTVTLPAGKTLIQLTNDSADLNKDYLVDYGILGDARLILRQLGEACREIVGPHGRPNPDVAAEIETMHTAWRSAWAGKLTDRQRPINPYRVIQEFMNVFDPHDCIVTHDSGNPRGQLVAFYRAGGPRSFLGWGKSHGLGTGLGLILGAKLACPDKVCVNFMGDAAFGMVGLDFETAVRHRIPIITVVLNNGGMASEARAMPRAEADYRTSVLGGDYAAVARALGGHAERIEDPEAIAPAFQRARKVTEEEGQPVLLDFITSRETASSSPGRQFQPQ